MDEFPPMQTDDVNEVLSSSNSPLLQPVEFTKVVEEQLDDDCPPGEALDKLHAALQPKAVLEKAKSSLRQTVDASERRNPALRRKNAAVVRENATLRQRNATLEKSETSLRQELCAYETRNAALCEKNAALSEKNAALEKAETSLRQELYASETRNALLGQKENKSLGQELAGSQIYLNLRQLLTEHRRNGMGRDLDNDLLKKARNTWPADFNYEPKDFFKNPVNTYSGFVIHLETERMNLLKKKNDDNPSSDRLSEFNSEIKSIETKLGRLKVVATSFQKPEMKWNGNTFGEGYYTWCLYAAYANKACHPNMTKELLNGMSKCIARREYTYKGVNLGPTIQAAIQEMLLRIASTS